MGSSSTLIYTSELILCSITSYEIVSYMGYLTTSRTNSNVCKIQLLVWSAMSVDSIILLLLCTVSTGYPLSIEYSLKFYFLFLKLLMDLPLCIYQKLLQPKPVPRYNLRSCVNALLLKYPTFKSLATLGDRSFTFAAPKLWNNLPCDIRSASNLDTLFKRLLKTICLERPIVTTVSILT